MKENEAKEYYEVLLGWCQSGDEALEMAYRQLRELLEQLCATQIESATLQMTDLSARISLMASKLGLPVREQNRLHTFRLTGNAVMNRQAQPERGKLMRDIKTLAFLVRRLSGVEIPAELYRSLPRADATYELFSRSKEKIRRMRVCYHEADGQYLYVMPVDTLSDELLRVRYNVPQVNDEFAVTCSLLWKYAQLNLLDVYVDESGILVPSFIILEPDYLLDISSLAECFRDYGHSPLNYAMARLQQPENTAPILLGNIANLFLDEWIHTAGEPDYMQCMRKAFRSYAVELATCAELWDREKEQEFFRNCRLHFENIKRTVTETFRMAGYELQKDDAVLEPSYICEALGLQGRLDYMQRDMTSFIEMKSGKADEYSIRGKIEPKENNKVQMLLYQAVLEYSMGMDHRKVKSYLLYTRYPLLYPARPSWAMVRRVMDVRNRIVAAEYDIQSRNDSGHTASFLDQINRNVLNERRLDNVLWKRFLAPQIDRFTEQWAALSPLEREYFCAVYNFITKELLISKMGAADYEGRYSASSWWQATFAEKCDSGEILYDLSIKENHASDVHKPYLVLDGEGMPAEGQQPALPNFRQGDAVVLYERNRPGDDVTNKMVFKGSIEWMMGHAVCIRLRAAQRNAGVLPPDSRYAIEHDYMDTSYRSMYQGLSCFLNASRQRRDLLLGKRLPESAAENSAMFDAVDDDFERIALKADAAKDLFLLVGPPGTGKTSRALRRMVEMAYHAGKQLLLLSYTNRAVDEICKMLASVTPGVDFIRMGSELSCEAAYRPYLVENVLESAVNRKDVLQRLDACRIFVGTVSTLSSHTELFRLKTFDVAFIDEATQILEPQLLGLLCMRGASGDNAIRKFVMIGDYKQLPAVVLQSAGQSEIHQADLRAAGVCNLKDSLFERLYRRLTTGADVPDPHLFYDMLCKQGRMNVEVASFPNRAFYGGVLRPVGLSHQFGSLSLDAALSGNEFADILAARVAFLPSVTEKSGQPVKVNHCEAEIVARLASAVYWQYRSGSSFDPQQTLGVITPYRSQIALIRQCLSAQGIAPLNDILVDTVERFQGSERDVIIYSCCVNRSWQIKQLVNTIEDEGCLIDRKLNVALTRARKQMFVTGVPDVLRQSPIYAHLLDSIGYVHCGG